jgi:hypothetical protein
MHRRRRSILIFILWLSDSTFVRVLISLPLQGFDEFMNLVLDEAAEVFVKEAKPRRDIGTPTCCTDPSLSLTSRQVAFCSKVTTSPLSSKSSELEASPPACVLSPSLCASTSLHYAVLVGEI